MPLQGDIPFAGRDFRLDLFRGLANWAIFLDHIPHQVLSRVTIDHYGFSGERTSIANLDSAEYPSVTVPVALANEAAYRLFDVDRRRRIVNRWRRRSGTCQGAAEQCPADKSAHHASGNLTILRSSRHWQQKRADGQCHSRYG
jgi:hypothetical protein